MPEEAPDVDERVLKRLEDDGWYNDGNKLLGYARGHLDAADLSYEDWVRPLKLTGGRVCLKHEWEYGAVACYACWFPDGLRERCEDGTENGPEHAVWTLKKAMQGEDITITPVPVEATPFAEEAGHDD